jgi:nitrate reductase gamma subunit
LYRLYAFPGWRSNVLLAGLLVAAPYFIFIMGPSEHATQSSKGLEAALHIMNILRGRIIIGVLCVAAFFLLATEKNALGMKKSVTKKQS